MAASALAGEPGMLCSALGNFLRAFPLGFLPDGAEGRFFPTVLQWSSGGDLSSCFLLSLALPSPVPRELSGGEGLCRTLEAPRR